MFFLKTVKKTTAWKMFFFAIIRAIILFVKLTSFGYGIIIIIIIIIIFILFFLLYYYY